MLVVIFIFMYFKSSKTEMYKVFQVSFDRLLVYFFFAKMPETTVRNWAASQKMCAQKGFDFAQPRGFRFVASKLIRPTECFICFAQCS